MIENVPARICIETGEQLFSPETVNRIQAIIRKKLQPKVALLLVLFTVIHSTPHAASLFVEDTAQLTDLATQLRAGDSLVLRDGIWTNVVLRVTASGNSGAPITVRANTPGGVVITGNSYIEFSGEWLILEGFFFANGTASSSDGLIRFTESSRHCALRENAIVGFDQPRETGGIHPGIDWVWIMGQNHELSRNTFGEKTGRGRMVRVTAGDATERHRIVNNLFFNRPRGSPHGDANGYETLLIHTPGSSQPEWESHIDVSTNMFYRCSGEYEIISNKTSSNAFVRNVFWECEGNLVLRIGQNNLVSGNRFFGNYREYTGGVRLTDARNTVVNNHFSCLAGQGVRAACVLTSGLPEGRILHPQTTSSTIAFNTFWQCAQTLLVGYYFAEDVEAGISPPLDCLVANNIFVAQSPIVTVITEFGSTENIRLQRNIFNVEPESSEVHYEDSLIMDDPLLALGSDGVSRLLENSPAIDAGIRLEGVPQTDIDGQLRDDKVPDIGADEFDLGTPRTTFGSGNVGASWYPFAMPEYNREFLRLSVTAGPLRGLEIQGRPGSDYLIQRSDDFRFWSEMIRRQQIAPMDRIILNWDGVSPSYFRTMTTDSSEN